MKPDKARARLRVRTSAATAVAARAGEILDTFGAKLVTALGDTVIDGVQARVKQILTRQPPTPPPPPWTPPGPTSQRPQNSSDDPYQALGTVRGMSLDYYKSVYRALASQAHPDHGGDPTAMARLNRAWDQIEKELSPAVRDS